MRKNLEEMYPEYYKAGKGQDIEQQIVEESQLDELKNYRALDISELMKRPARR